MFFASVCMHVFFFIYKEYNNIYSYILIDFSDFNVI